jgi:hypothetical protein
MKLTFWILILLIILAVLAIKYLPWWALIILLVGGGLGLQWAVKYGLKQAFLLPFKVKGQVLKGAAVQVHNVQPTNMPTVKQNADSHPGEIADQRARYHQLKWYTVDVSIAPQPTDATVPFPAWEPRDLVLVVPGKKVKSLESLAADEVSTIHDYEIYQTNRFQSDSEGKHLGSQRLKFLVGIEPGISTLQFRYYLELFGQVEFPDRTVANPQLKSA